MAWRARSIRKQRSRDDIADELLHHVLRTYEQAGMELWPAIEGALRGAIDEATLAKLAAAFESGSVTAVEHVIDWQAVGASLASDMGPGIQAALRSGADLALRRAPGRIDLDFQVLDPRTQDYLGRVLPNLIREVTDETRNAVRLVIEEAYNTGLGPRAAARQIRNAIGLTQRQAQAVVNFRAGLVQTIETDSPIATLHTQWSASRDVVHSERALTLANVDTLTERYQRRLVMGRALNIARTEGIRAINFGQAELWKEAARVGALDRTVDLLQWITTPDERACVICLPMHGTTQPIGGSFEAGGGGFVEYPPAHPQCRCAVIMVTGRARSEARERTDARIEELRDERGLEAVA